MKSEGKFKCLDCVIANECEIYQALFSCSGDVLQCLDCKLAPSCKNFNDMLLCQNKHLNKRLKAKQKMISESFRGKTKLERI